jgi:hypothetical protein
MGVPEKTHKLCLHGERLTLSRLLGALCINVVDYEVGHVESCIGAKA